MAYTTINKSGDYFNTKLYSGNGTAIGSGGQAITGVGFQPDFTWIKERSSTSPHKLLDAVRGVTKELESNLTNAESTQAESLASFDSDGFTVGSNGAVNENSQTYASWNWKAGGGQGSSNTDGSINTTYTSVNTTAGFSISSYTGTGSNATVGHGLGVAPKIVIVKNRTGTQGWGMYNKNIGAGNYLALNTTTASSSASTIWNSTDPTTAVFSVGTSGWTNDSGQNYIAYCFAEKTGYSKFGSYTGNGANDGSFCYLGFKPAFVIAKDSSAVNNWRLFDNKRPEFNLTDKLLFPSLSDAETVNVSGGGAIDILSNGFKIRSSANGLNASGATYIFMAFAEAPLVGTNNVPCTAR